MNRTSSPATSPLRAGLLAALLRLFGRRRSSSSSACPPLSMRAGQKCRSPSDCQSGSCIDGTCGEAKQCASRYFTETFGGTLGLTKSSFIKSPQAANLIKCGQCLCEPCPVSNLLLGSGGCSSCCAVH